MEITVSQSIIYSYAQQFEDIVLWRALKDVRKGVYIDVGASHPIFDSVSYLFYNQGWRGIHVEPSPEMASLIRKERPEEFVLDFAVSDKPGEVNLHEPQDHANQGLSTADPSTAQLIQTYGLQTQPRKVKCVTLDTIFSLCQEPEIHWLKIDVEGIEEKALTGWTCDRRPWIVVVESLSPLENKPNHQKWEPLLTQMGYRYVWSDFVNRFYLHKAHWNRKKYFRYAPNITDGFLLSKWASFGRQVVAQCETEMKHTVEIEKQRISSDLNQLHKEKNDLAAKILEHDQIIRNLNNEHETQCVSLTSEITSLQSEKTELLNEVTQNLSLIKKLEKKRKILVARNMKLTVMNRRYISERQFFLPENRRLEIENQCFLQQNRHQIENLTILKANLSDYEKELQTKNTNLWDIENKLNQLDKDVEQLHAEKNSLKEQNNASLETIAAIYKSRSWRVTSPLRFITRGLRRCKNITLSLFGKKKGPSEVVPQSNFEKKPQPLSFSSRKTVGVRDFVRDNFPSLFARIRCNKVLRKWFFDIVGEADPMVVAAGLGTFLERSLTNDREEHVIELPISDLPSDTPPGFTSPFIMRFREVESFLKSFELQGNGYGYNQGRVGCMGEGQQRVFASRMIKIYSSLRGTPRD